MGCFQTGLAGKSAAGTAVDPVTRSLRFDEGTPTLSRTPTSSGSQRKFTLSMWIKRTRLDSTGYETIWGSEVSGANYCILTFYEDCLQFQSHVSGHTYTLKSNAKYRDVSAFYHITLSVDTDQELEANRIKIYVNGEEVTFSSSSYPTRYYDLQVNTSTYPVTFGYSGGTAAYFAGYYSDIHFIDGEAKLPTDFIETTGYGSYKPKAYTGSFGTNGFHIDAQPANDADLLVSSIARNDGDTDFADAAAGHTITRSGALHSIAAGNPFTGDDRAMKFTGSLSNNLQTDASSDLTFGTGDFYIQTWVNPSTVSTQWQALIGDDHYSSSGGFVLYMGYDNLYCYRSGSAVHTINDVFTVGKWTHVAWSRSGGTSKVYVDGVEMDSVSNSYDFTSDRLWIGRQNHSSLYAFNGYLYDVEIRVGAGGDGSKPPSKVSAEANTKLLIQPDKDNAIHDETDNQTITTNGTVTRTASTPYDAAAKSTAMFFDGSNDWIQVSTASSDFQFGTGDFTIEGWFNFAHLTGYQVICDLRPSNSADSTRPSFSTNGAGINMHFNGGNTSLASDGFVVGTWHHVAFARASGSLKTYIDGVLKSTTSFTNDLNTSAIPHIGATDPSPSQEAFLSGYAYDFRVTKGTAQYTSGFTAPSAPFELNPVYIGGDQSGNKAHFQPTNISTTDIRTDVPTDSFCVMSPIDKGSGVTLSEGNLKAVCNNDWDNVRGTMGATSGKFYYEVVGNIAASTRWNAGVDINQKCQVDTYNNNTGSIVYSLYDGLIYDGAGGNSSATQDQSETNARIGVAVDIDAGKVWFRYNNGSWELSGGDPTSGSSSGSETFTAGSLVQPLFAGYGATFTVHFQESEWTDTAPTDYGEWKTSRLGTPVVNPAENFNTVLYNGSYDSANGVGTASQAITGVGFSSGIVWIKDRDNRSSNNNGYLGHYWFDTVLGTASAVNIDNNQGIYGTLNSGEDGISSFDSDGFTVDEAEETNFNWDSNGDYSPDTPERYVAWCWKLGTTASSWSGAGQDPDTEHYNSAAGISVIDYTDGNYAGTSITLNHSLGEAPELVIALDYAGNSTGHNVWHVDLAANQYLALHSTGDAATDSAIFPSGGATNTTIEIGANIVDGMQTHAVLFRSVEGFSSIGSYTGGTNPFIYTGFKVGFWMVKRIDSTGHWTMFDSARDTHNLVDQQLEPNYSNAESGSSTKGGDFLSNGFKVRSSQNEVNATGGTYIYAAFAEVPFSKANAR